MFIVVTKNINENKKTKIAIKSVLVATLILLFFLAIGEIILEAIEVPLSAFQIAGGIVLFLFAFTMIFGESKSDEEISGIKDEEDKAIFPLASPSIANPGAMIGAVMLTENSSVVIFDQFITAIIMLTHIAAKSAKNEKNRLITPKVINKNIFNYLQITQ